MNYEKIIIELLSRIQAIEEKIGIISGGEAVEGIDRTIGNGRKKYKMSTAEIKKYIEELLESEKQAGKEYTELICGILHKQLGLKNAVPMVCNAMKSCMKVGDTVVFRSPSGFSATLKIRYNLVGYKNGARPDVKIIKTDARAEISATTAGTNGTSAAALGRDGRNTMSDTKQNTQPQNGAAGNGQDGQNGQDGSAAGLGAKGTATKTKAESPLPSPLPSPAPSRAIPPAPTPVPKLVPTPVPTPVPPQTGRQNPSVASRPAPAKADLSPVAVWQRILDNEWAIFYLPDGAEFAYIAGNDYLAIVRTNYRLPRADIEKALALYPFKNAVPLQHLRYPSYIYAVLTDERIISR